MPVYSDLKEIKEIIQKIGNEKKILEQENKPINDTPLPEKIDSTINTDYDKDSIKDDNNDDLLNDILTNITQDETGTEDQISSNNIEVEKKQENIETQLFDIDSLKDQEDPLKKTQDESSDLDAVLDNITKNKIEETGELESEELSALLGETEKPEEKINLDETEDQFEDYNTLLGDISSANDESSSQKDNIDSTKEEESLPDISDSFIENKETNEAGSNSFLDNIDSGEESLSNFNDLSIEKKDEDVGLGDINEISNLELDSLGSELGAGSDNESNQEVLEGVEKFDFANIESLSHEDNKFTESLSDSESLFETPVVLKDKEKKKDKNKEKDLEFKDSSLGKIPEEIAEEDVKKDKDIEFILTDDERKQIIISLANLPKEAELKIAKSIISGKYSNEQLKPLIDSLIRNESPNVILKYYEKITFDKSLSHIIGFKYTGQKFEERQKSLGYLFQKNIMPILSVLFSAGIIVLLLLVLFIRFIMPSWEASKYYGLGKKNIKENLFEESKINFDKGFEIQPRFNEAVDYARLYRKYKRYLEAEKKYELANNMKPDRIDISLEYADFFREKKDYERSEKKYKLILASNNKYIPAMLGLAKTYFDWAEEIHEKYNDAEQVYFDVLEIDKKNKDAVYGKLYIHIKKNNYPEIMKHYRYIERNFGRKVDPVVYNDLASYLLDIKEVDNVKDILDKASRSVKKNQIMPEIDYQYARYKKYLNVYDEEKKHLEKALSKLEALEKKDIETYNSVKYQKLLSRVYNDLGENYDRYQSSSIKAEECYQKALLADPNYGRTYYNLANYTLKYKSEGNGYEIAKNNYLEAEQKGFSNDRLTYNLGWLYYKEKNYLNSFQRINTLLSKYKDNSNLKFMIGTIYYKMGNYELSESMMLETYIHFSDLSQQYFPLELEIKEDRMILEMLKKTSNNLGASYQKKYEKTRITKYLITASKYYSESLNYFHKIETDSGNNANEQKELANINLRMVLYPYESAEEPFIYEDFPMDYETTM